MTSKSKYRIELSKRAEKDFARLDKSIQKMLFQKLSDLEKSADPLKNSAKLVNYKNHYRHRFGDYRVIFTIEADGQICILLILKVAHRKDIYK